LGPNVSPVFVSKVEGNHNPRHVVSFHFQGNLPPLQKIKTCLLMLSEGIEYLST
jgi:hypothetical protein